MENALIVLMSVTSILVIYWVIFGQRRYNKIFRDYFQNIDNKNTTNTNIENNKEIKKRKKE